MTRTNSVWSSRHLRAPPQPVEGKGTPQRMLLTSSCSSSSEHDSLMFVLVRSPSPVVFMPRSIAPGASTSCFNVYFELDTKIIPPRCARNFPRICDFKKCQKDARLQNNALKCSRKFSGEIPIPPAPISDAPVSVTAQTGPQLRFIVVSPAPSTTAPQDPRRKLICK